MNLQAIVRNYTAVVSPPTIGTLYVSSGSTKAADYTRSPTFTVHDDVSFDVQAMSGRDLRQIEGLNLNGTLRAVYIQGNIEGVDRNAGKGGDILYFAGAYWLVVQVLEPWANNGWTKVAVILQTGVPPGITP